MSDTLSTPKPPTAPSGEQVGQHCLVLRSGQEIAKCPLCGGELSKETPILKGDEDEPIKDGNGVITAIRMAFDARPKCPHCYGRFDLMIILDNS